jgi:hypothetical protein
MMDNHPVRPRLIGRGWPGRFYLEEFRMAFIQEYLSGETWSLMPSGIKIHHKEI